MDSPAPRHATVAASPSRTSHERLVPGGRASRFSGTASASARRRCAPSGSPPSSTGTPRARHRRPILSSTSSAELSHETSFVVSKVTRRGGGEPWRASSRTRVEGRPSARFHVPPRWIRRIALVRTSTSIAAPFVEALERASVSVKASRLPRSRRLASRPTSRSTGPSRYRRRSDPDPMQRAGAGLAI